MPNFLEKDRVPPMFKKNNRRGFTLIEMLVVIAIIAILVSIVIPTVGESATRAKAATDAANLRGVLGSLNSQVMLDYEVAAEYIAAMEPVPSKTFPDAKLCVVYSIPGLIDVYYVDGTNYYGMAYFGAIAGNDSDEVEPTAPTYSDEVVWYEVGSGIIE